ncbi:hypothetical protein BJV78DRAFT_1178289 [Lactifluus subvellereus]|nr:hypothetical protein BJV78DRAFT_1178289 [Lactifluus subvellereus]
MLTTQSPIVLPRIHSLYSELPPNSRRAANLPFFAPRALPASASTACAPNVGSAPGSPPLFPRRNSIPRRNAISYHPSQPASESPFTNRRSGSLPPAEPASPRPRPALLVASGYTSEPKSLSYSPLVITLAPARVPRSQREYQAKMVASLLLSRGSRARPMRCARRGSFLRAGYQPSTLSVCTVAGDVDEGEVKL